MSQLDRIEQKVDTLAQMLITLLESLAEEDEAPAIDLNGNAYGGARDDGQAL
jgi:hypothetical protein